MSSSVSLSDHASVTEGPSVRSLRWSLGHRRRVYRAWPPTNSQSYPVLKQHRIYRHLVAQIGVGMETDAENDEVCSPEDRLLRARWRELADQKVEVYTIRSRIKGTRTRTQKARIERDAADNAFMSVARPLLTTPGPTGNTTVRMFHLPRLFQQMQTMRDKCQDHETSLEKLEDNLKHAQDQLDLLERRLINALRCDPPGVVGATREPLKLDIPPLSQSEQLLGLVIEPKTFRNESYRSLRKALTDFDSARRHHVELVAEKERVETQKESLRFFKQYHPAALQYVMPLQDEDLEFLRDFDAKQKSVLNEMERLREEVNELVRRCWREDVFPRCTPLAEVQNWFRCDASIDEGLEPDMMEARNTTITQFSTLLANPASHLLRDPPLTAGAALREAQAALRETGISSPDLPQTQSAFNSAAKEVYIQNLVVDAKEGDKPDLIRRWMLQALRTSTHEVEVLYSFYLDECPYNILDSDEWQKDVLNNWWGDEAGTPALGDPKGSATSWTTAPPTAPSWLTDPYSGSLYSSAAEIGVEGSQSQTSDSNASSGKMTAPEQLMARQLNGKIFFTPESEDEDLF